MGATLRTAITIANGTALPATGVGIDVKQGYFPCALLMPAAWTAAALTFQVSDDDGATWKNVYDDLGNEVSLTVAADRLILLTPAADWIGMSGVLVRPRSGTSGTPVNQGAARELVFFVRHEL